MSGRSNGGGHEFFFYLPEDAILYHIALNTKGVEVYHFKCQRFLKAFLSLPMLSPLQFLKQNFPDILVEVQSVDTLPEENLWVDLLQSTSRFPMFAALPK